ncbi:hypothetical protein BCR32DRAFT_301659 [Anaeromyces robustus]|uniref:Uncharacterized protein n=1 Tax=Anaeromyces robustus TaxID=1754192 RepID=A0A1Y1WYE8_9FUNG|nr:hypothetical protein BCR32DRAFT_301659 [Anaeromyces robustus]|eukprot:ORX78472.1 hypothetical protein BCR32DRAFT_301659 [Anaeromyces robustus]
MENLTNYYNEVIDIVCSKAVEVFNSNYNLNINKDNILNNLVNENDTQPPTKEMTKLNLNDTCIGVKRNKTNCTNKIIPGHMYCSIHIRLEGKLPLNKYIENVANTLKYEHKANVVSLGNQWMNKHNDQKTKDEENSLRWPISIKIKNNSPLRSYILFFNEFTSYLGAGILVIQYCSNDGKKQSNYFMATHYVEVNKYSGRLRSDLYAKMTLKSITSLQEKPIFNKMKQFLSEYGIPYDINDINKRNGDISEYNPVVVYNKINKILNDHYNILYFNYDAYINSNVDNN